MQASSCCIGKTCGHQGGFPPAHHPVLSTTAPRVVPRPLVLCEGFWLEAWQGGCTGRSREGPRCGQGMGLIGEELNLAHGPICSSCSQPCTVRTESVRWRCEQLALSTHGFGKMKINSINILALHFSTNTARISLLQYFVNNWLYQLVIKFWNLFPKSSVICLLIWIALT